MNDETIIKFASWQTDKFSTILFSKSKISHIIMFSKLQISIDLYGKEF